MFWLICYLHNSKYATHLFADDFSQLGLLSSMADENDSLGDDMSGREEGEDALDISKPVDTKSETWNWTMMCQEGWNTSPWVRILSYC